jgi:hypothetical protein
LKPYRGRRSLRAGRSTCEPAVGEEGEGEGDGGDEEGIDGHGAVESFELHESLSGEPVVEQLVDEVVVLPVGEADVGGVAALEGNGVAASIDHRQVILFNYPPAGHFESIVNQITCWS